MALDVIVKQIFEDGFFHADPHPGNVLMLGPHESPVIAMIDLGMVGRLSPRMRDLTIDLMVGAVRRDYDAIADAIYAIGTPTKKIDMDAFRAEVALLAEKYLGKQLREIELSSLIRDLVRGATTYGLEIPPDFMLVGKALMTIESVGKQIDPELDVFEESKPLFLELLRKRYSPERLGMELLDKARATERRHLQHAAADSGGARRPSPRPTQRQNPRPGCGRIGGSVGSQNSGRGRLRVVRAVGSLAVRGRAPGARRHADGYRDPAATRARRTRQLPSAPRQALNP